MKILIVSGGTGGHIIPALAVARALLARGIQVHWLGSQQGLEQKLVVAAGIPLHSISVQGVRGKGLKGLLLAPWRMLRASFEASRIMRREKPSLVMGFGGFVSAPGGVAAKLLRIPLVIQEQNALAGMTNRYLAPWSKLIFQAFPDTFAARYHPLTTGNPVRAEICQIPPPEQRYQQREGSLRVLILGGSQGALVLNQIVAEALSLLPPAQQPRIWHMTGTKAVAEVTEFYQVRGIDAKVAEFIDDMASAYAWADLVISRAGALTVSELAVAGVPSILIPFPHAVDDHQTKNANYLVAAGAAVLLPQSLLSVASLMTLLTELTDRQRLLQMAQAARQFGKPQATEEILSKILGL